MNFRGSISIFLALVIFTISGFFVFLMPIGQAKRLESLAEAALLRQVEVLLASYHRDLMERYGLPGILEEDADLTVLPWLLDQKGHEDLVMELVWQDDYSNDESLEQVILESMSLRMPAIVIDEIWQHMKGLLPASTWDDIAINLSIDPFQAFFHYLEGRVHEQDIMTALMDPESDLANAEEFQELKEELDKIKEEKSKAEIIARSESDENLPKLDDFAAVSAYLGKIRDKLYEPFRIAYDSLVLREFMVSYLSCEIRHPEKIVPPSNPFSTDTSPRMWRFSEEHFTSDYELECLITGMTQPIIARTLVHAEIFAIRFLLNAVALYNDPGKMANYRLGNFWQRLIVMLLTVFGFEPATVNEVIVCLRLLIDAVNQSTKDLADLCDGYAIPIFHGPLGKYGIKLDYLHYARFLLLFSSNQELLRRFRPIMEENVEGKDHKLGFRLDLEIQSSFHTMRKTRKASYKSHAE